MTDSEYNLDASCLSRCSTELFSEASWEQVDKNDTEVSCLAEWDATIEDLDEGWKMDYSGCRDWEFTDKVWLTLRC